ncbi:MAG: hypothetical protein KatS3mg115_0330 [Candidatus Poribacteria bacterium]|nr:MAG: hypothetical protein KatS3mg115_0330 [Candidatus Poribacteria bacterium]
MAGRYLASRSVLAQIAKELRLDAHLIHNLPEGEALPETARERLLANALEALLGAVYCDAGFLAARHLARRILEPHLEGIAEELGSHLGDYKSALQELWQQQTGEAPHYEVLEQEGPPHAPMFRVAVYLGTEQFGVGDRKQQAGGLSGSGPRGAGTPQAGAPPARPGS